MIPLQTDSGHPVTHIVFSPDGAMVAVAQPHYGVTLLERATGRTLGVCALPRRDVLTGLTFCGDNCYLAAASHKGVEVFDAATGAAVATCFRPRAKALKLAERGGELVGGKSGAGVRVVWRPDPPTDGGFASDPIPTWLGAIGALSPDGRFALTFGPMGRGALTDLTAGRTVVVVVEYAEGTHFYEWPGKATFRLLGHRFAINDGDTLDVYDAGELADESEAQYADTPLVQRAGDTRYETGYATAVAPAPHVVLKPTFTLTPDKPGERGWHPPFALLADGRGLLVKRPRNRIQLWDAPAGALVNEWSWRFEWVTCVAVAADGLTAVAGGRFGRVLLWDLD